MSHDEIARKMDSIIEFSELQDSIDRPFKTYSSGMQARLTFSTAVSVDPDILIIDEALAVGDALFVGKCHRRIREIVSRGTTVLFVSHSTDSIRLFCDHAVWLSKGKVVVQGDANTVTKAYDRFIYEQSYPSLGEHTTAATELARNPSAGRRIGEDFFKYGGNEVNIVDLKFVDGQGKPTMRAQSGDHLEVHITYQGRMKNPNEVCHASVQIFSTQGPLVASGGTRRCSAPFKIGERGVFKMVLSPLLLGTGDYFFSPYLGAFDSAGNMRWLDFHDRCYCLQVKGRIDPTAPQMIEHPSEWRHDVLEAAPTRVAA
jgi:lipopolysaccharide transport system ATP-binding protein